MGYELKVLKVHSTSATVVSESWLENDIDLNSVGEIKCVINALKDREKIENVITHYQSYSELGSDPIPNRVELRDEVPYSGRPPVGQTHLHVFIWGGKGQKSFKEDMESDEGDNKPSNLPNLESLLVFKTSPKTKKRRLVQNDDINDVQIDSIDEANLADKPRDVSDSPKPPRKPFNFLNFIFHPGNWMLLTLIAVGIAFFAPPLALSALGAIILTGMTVTLALLPRYIMNYWEQLKADRATYASKAVELAQKNHAANPTKVYEEKDAWQYAPNKAKAMFMEMPRWVFGIGRLVSWAFGDKNFKKQAHGWQAFFVGLGFIVFTLALVFTIGFFTGGGALVAAGGVIVASGGGAFAFMGSVFAAISAPFVALTAAAVAAGTTTALSPVALGLLSGTLFLIAPLNLIANTPKRLIRFFSELRSGDAVESKEEDVLAEKTNAVDGAQQKDSEKVQLDVATQKYEESLVSNDDEKSSSEDSRKVSLRIDGSAEKTKTTVTVIGADSLII